MRMPIARRATFDTAEDVVYALILDRSVECSRRSCKPKIISGAVIEADACVLQIKEAVNEQRRTTNSTSARAISRPRAACRARARRPCVPSRVHRRAACR